MWLDICKARAEEVLRPLDCGRLNDIDFFAAAVVATSWVAFCILVGEYGALRLHDRLSGVIFRRDHLEAVALTSKLGIDALRDLGVKLCKRGVRFERIGDRRRMWVQHTAPKCW